MELIFQFPLRPLRSHRDRTEAKVMARTLSDIPVSKRSAAERIYLEVLDRVIRHSEVKEVVIDGDTVCDRLDFLMRSNGLTQTQLSIAVGIAPSTISEILSGKRKLTRGQIEKLSAYFQVSPNWFFSAPKPRRKAAK
jgi:antitoxin component HigA of HigAB toxin-antitoxin module